MAEKFLPCNNPYDQLALLAEIVMTLRTGFGMAPAVYDPQKGGLIVPDALVKKKTRAEKKAEDEAQAKAEAHAEKLRTDANKKTAKDSKRPEPKPPEPEVTTEAEEPKA